MNRTCSFLLVVVISTLAGCTSKHSENSATESATASVSLFKEGKGVWFSEETRKLFGLEVAEVAEKPMLRHVEKTAQVYRAASKAEPANALIMFGADETKELIVGQPMSLRKEKGDSKSITGKLIRLDEQTSSVFGRVEALIEFADPDGRFALGDFLTATFTNGEAKAVFVVPETALLVAADGSYVYAVNGTHLTRTRVKTGASSDGFIEIEDGLYAGDSVAAKGMDCLWQVELSALKGGTPCCPVAKKNEGK